MRPHNLDSQFFSYVFCTEFYCAHLYNLLSDITNRISAIPEKYSTPIDLTITSLGLP